MASADSRQPVHLQTLADCRLTIGRYPAFAYDASGGGGAGTGHSGGGDLSFDAAALRVPPLNSRSTRFLGLPLPPGLEIAIAAQRLQGTWQPATGQVELEFLARFRFRIRVGSFDLYRAPDLNIACTLNTGTSAGRRHCAQGRALDSHGEGVLVGVATVHPSGDPWLDRFLGLPDEALAVLHCRIESGT